MKILRTISSFYPCVRGPVKLAFKISSQLEKMGIASPVLTTSFGADGSPAREKIDDVCVFRYKIQIKIMKYHVSLGLAKGLYQECDIIHSHEYRAFQSDLGCLMASIRKIPFVINTDGNLLCYKYILKRALPKFPYVLHDLITLKSAAKRADAVIVTSKIEYEDAVKFGIKKKKIRIIPIGIDTSLYDGDIDLGPGNKIPDSDGKIKLLFAGRLSRDRNLEPILYAVKELPEVVFYVIGGDLETSGFARYNYRETLKKLSIRLGIDNRIKFIGQQSEKELIGWYKQADIFINTSKYESFGTAILEAAASGLPVISTPVGIANEIVKDCYSGFIVPDEPRFIAQRIKELFSEKLRAEFGSRLRKSAVDSFGWQNVMDKYIKLYEDLSR